MGFIVSKLLLFSAYIPSEEISDEESNEPHENKIRNTNGDKNLKFICNFLLFKDTIQLSLHKNLIELQKKIYKKFKRYRNYEFDPHVSLAYGNFTPDKKDISLISHQEMISFSSIAIVNTPNKIKNWDIIQKFDSV